MRTRERADLFHEQATEISGYSTRTFGSDRKHTGPLLDMTAVCISFIDFVDSHICFGGFFSLSQVKLPIIYLNTICDIFHILVSLFCKTFDKIKCFDLSNLFN